MKRNIPQGVFLYSKNIVQGSLHHSNVAIICINAQKVTELLLKFVVHFLLFQSSVFFFYFSPLNS